MDFSSDKSVSSGKFMGFFTILFGKPKVNVLFSLFPK